MTSRDMSPEEKLLSLIKKKEKKPFAPSAPEPSKKEEAPVPSMAKTGMLMAEARVSKILKSELFKNKAFEPKRLQAINRYLVIGLVLFLGYFLIDLIFVKPYKNVQSVVANAEKQSAAELSAEVNKIVTVKDYASYSSAIPDRTVFGPAQAGAGAQENISSSDEITERVGLVGILTGENPQAIIEDKKVQKTYYLNKGQSFDGYIIEDISENKVTLDYEGKKISLFL